MSLKSKILLILFGVVALYAVIDNGSLRLFVSPRFEKWELEEAEGSLALVLEGIQDEIERLDDTCRIWANWDATRDYALDPAANADYEEANLGRHALETAQVDVLCIVEPPSLKDPELPPYGDVVWGRVVDPATGGELQLRELPPSLVPHHFLMKWTAEKPFVSGLMLARDESSGDVHHLIVSARPILGRELLARGEEALLEGGGRIEQPVLIMGRFFDEKLIQAISSRSDATFDVWDQESEQLPDTVRSLLPQITSIRATDQAVSEAGDDGMLHLYEKLGYVNTGLPIILRANVEREITSRGKAAFNYALLSTLATALMILLVLLRLLHTNVIRPLSRLTNHAVAIGKTDDTSAKLELERSDEIGQLSDEFDRMMEKLARSRELTVKAARQAGMSEIATGVLHNVGNVLNSVNVSANLAAKKSEQLPVKDLEMLVDVLEKQEDLGRFVTEDPKGKHLLPFLSQLTDSLRGQSDALMQEIKSLGGGIDHMAELVRSQQSYAGSKGVFERASLTNEVDAAIKICKQAYGGSDDLQIVRDFDEDLPMVPIDKHKTMEILVNLIQNARQAIDDADPASPCLTLRVKRAEGDTARIEVQDNGIGIPEEQLTKIFNHGFTTKKDGHGFGLHVSANAATEMHASLTARSDGVGHGATFILEIPMKSEELLAVA